MRGGLLFEGGGLVEEMRYFTQVGKATGTNCNHGVPLPDEAIRNQVYTRTHPSSHSVDGLSVSLEVVHDIQSYLLRLLRDAVALTESV